MSTEEPIRLEQEVTVADQEKALATYARATRRIWAARYVGGLGMLTGLLLAALGHFAFALVGVLYGWLVLAGAWDRWYRRRFVWRRNPQRLGQMAADVSADGVVLSHATPRPPRRPRVPVI